MHQLCEYINIKPLLDPCCKHGAQQQFVMCMWCFYSDQPVSFTSAFELSAPTSGRGVNCVHFSLLADLSTLSVWAGGMFHQWVSWIVPMNEPCPACAYTPPHLHPTRPSSPITLHLRPDSRWPFSSCSSCPEASVWTRQGAHMSSSLCRCRPCGECTRRVDIGLLCVCCAGEVDAEELHTVQTELVVRVCVLENSLSLTLYTHGCLLDI